MWPRNVTTQILQSLYYFISSLEPEYLASPHLDELSGMTYLSYFMKEEDSPGYYATLNWVKNQIPHQRINNFRVSLFLIRAIKKTHGSRNVSNQWQI